MALGRCRSEFKFRSIRFSKQPRCKPKKWGLHSKNFLFLRVLCSSGEPYLISRRDINLVKYDYEYTRIWWDTSMRLYSVPMIGSWVHNLIYSKYKTQLKYDIMFRTYLSISNKDYLPQWCTDFGVHMFNSKLYLWALEQGHLHVNMYTPGVRKYSKPQKPWL